MYAVVRVLFLCIIGVFVVSSDARAVRWSKYSHETVITRDIAIVGGGASGAHAAVRLREDYGKSVVVVEKQNRLGGHVATYADPTTGTPYDYGVQTYIDYRGARDFFARFNVSIGAYSRTPTASRYFDFKTGKTATGYIPPSSTDLNNAIRKYLNECEKYEDMMLPGFEKFPTPDKIPADLLLPFGKFAKKYGIEAAVPQMLTISDGWPGGITTAPTLYAMQAFGAPLARAFTGTPFFTPMSRNNSELYRKIGALLGNDVLYSSEVISAKRNGTGVELVVKSQNGSTKIIRAKRLLVSFEPTLEAMAPLKLDDKEADVFSKWSWVVTFAGIITHPSLPVNTTVVNTPLDAIPSNYLAHAEPPAAQSFAYIGKPGWRVLTNGNETLNLDRTIQVVQDSIDAMIEQDSLPKVAANSTSSSDKVQFVALAGHGPMKLSPSVKDIQSGFFQTKNSLQGHLSTWYTGSTWSAHYTSIVWAYTDTLLPRLLEGL